MVQIVVESTAKALTLIAGASVCTIGAGVVKLNTYNSKLSFFIDECIQFLH
jgi:hypothetical protein